MHHIPNAMVRGGAMARGGERGSGARLHPKRYSTVPYRAHHIQKVCVWCHTVLIESIVDRRSINRKTAIVESNALSKSGSSAEANPYNKKERRARAFGKYIQHKIRPKIIPEVSTIKRCAWQANQTRNCHPKLSLSIHVPLAPGGTWPNKKLLPKIIPEHKCAVGARRDEGHGRTTTTKKHHSTPGGTWPNNNEKHNSWNESSKNT